MPVNGVIHERGFQFGGFPGAGCPMIDAVNRVVIEAGLKTLSVLSQVKQQPGEKCFGFKPQRKGKTFRQFCHRMQVVLQ